MDNEVFRLLKSSLARAGEVDAVVRGFQRLATGLASQLGAPGQVFLQVAEQLSQDVGQARVGDDSEFWTYFAGRGPMAQRLADASMIDEALYGRHTAAKCTKVARVLTKFNYQPSDDPADLHDFHAFCQNTFELLQPGNLEVSPVDPYPIFSIQEAVTGFYWQDHPEQGRSHQLVLAGQIAGTEIRVAFFAGTYTPPQLHVYHPQECVWLQYEGMHVLPGMHECLDQQLELAYSQLHEKYRQTDWTAQWASLAAQASQVFARSAVLPVTQRGFVRVAECDRQINVIEAGYKVMFQSVTGDYPNETCTIMSQMSGDGKIAFTVQFQDLPAETQCRLASVVQHELTSLMHSIEAAEELAQQDALAP